jgi:triosephosphate isomerase (TIM)
MQNRRPLIAGNWKMYKTSSEAETTAGELVSRTADTTEVDVMIAPPYTALSVVSEIIADTHVLLGAQNLFWEAEGAFTGEISPAMLVSAGCSHVIIGHSERRQYFGETDDAVNKKIRVALAHGLTPVFCVGESEKERDAEETFSVLDKQVKIGLKDFFSKELVELVIAYEPVWAIGTGKTASREQAQEVHAFLRNLLREMVDESLAARIRILYGGSVKPANIKELMDMPDVDGALVGGASLNAETFSKIVNYK